MKELEKLIAGSFVEILCSECNAVFKRGSGEFTRHLAITQCRPYICDVCGKLFKKKSNMVNHKLTHSENNLQCHCGQIFKCQKYLQNHERRKHQIKIEKIDEPKAKRPCNGINEDSFERFAVGEMNEV